MDRSRGERPASPGGGDAGAGEAEGRRTRARRVVDRGDPVGSSTWPPVVVAGKSAVLNILRCVAPAGVPVSLVSFRASAPLYRSRLFQQAYDVAAPDPDPEDFIEGLLEVGRAAGSPKPVLYYGEDATLLAISRHRERLLPFFSFNLPAERLVEDAIDKGRFARLAAELGLPVPASATFGGERGYDSEGLALRFPLVAKPLSRVGWFGTPLYARFGRGGKAIGIPDARTFAEVLSLCEQSDTAIAVQELVQGPEANILSYHAYVSRDGAVLGEFTGRKHRTFPTEYGLSSCVEVCDLPEVRTLGRSMLDRMGLIGPSKLDFKRDERTGELYLLEINPRYNLWHYPAMVAGVNLPLIAYRDLAGLPPLAGAAARRNVTWVQGGLDRSAIAEKGGWYGPVWLKRLGRRTVYDIWSWRDPLPFLFLMVAKIRRRFPASRRSAKIA